MDFIGTAFPGVPDPNVETQSQRNYLWDPTGSLSQQRANAHEFEIATVDNITNLTVWKAQAGVGDPRTPQRYPGQDFGNVELTKPVHQTEPGWWGVVGVGGICNNWDDLRKAGVGYGLYAPHQPAQPVPAWKLYEPGSGFVLPATFLGQPLVPAARPPGT